jgi:methionyl-tRNA formyltransferase
LLTGLPRVVFLGTPEFAVPSLEALVRLRDQRKIELAAVVTQPDRPGHRGRITAPPAKEAAIAHGVRVIQPAPLLGDGPRWRTTDMWNEVARLHPDALVVAAYGGLVPRRVIDAVHGRAINVHPSLLPRWRGADPVAHAILAGDETIGVTLMEMTQELDAGSVIAQVGGTYHPGSLTTGELESRLARDGAQLLEDTIVRYLQGNVRTHPQTAKWVTWAAKLDPKKGELDFERPAEELVRLVRAYTPDPGAYTSFRGQRIVVTRASVAAGSPAEHGTLKVERGGPHVAAGAGWLRLDEVKPAGKRGMSGADWARGLRDLEGARLPS